MHSGLAYSTSSPGIDAREDAPEAAVRQQPTEAFRPIDLGARLQILPLEPQVRFAVQGGHSIMGAVAAALNVDPPPQVCASVAAEGVHILRLGPFEWHVVASEERRSDLRRRLMASLKGNAFSFVDISHRNSGFRLEGHAAAEVINSGCPLDLRDRVFPLGACTRTLFYKAEVMIWRSGPDAYAVEATRSVCRYVGACLREAAREHGADQSL